MTTSTHATYLPALAEPHQREDVGHQLQTLLVELVDLSLLGKQLHWSVVGPHFRSLHLQLDELIDSWRDLGDTVAERAIAIGTAVDGQARAVAADSPLAGVQPGAIEDRVLVRELAARLAETAERTRERAERVSELDPATEDVLIEVIRALEEQLWMVRA